MVALAEAEGGADVKQCRTSDGNTLLHVACKRGYAEMVSTLMACNASLTVKNKQGQLPIDVAANDEIKQLISGEMTARFDHGLKRSVIPPPLPDVDSEAAAAAAAELEQDIQQDDGEGMGGAVGAVTVNVTTTVSAVVVASEDNEESEDSSSDEDEDDDDAMEKKKKKTMAIK